MKTTVLVFCRALCDQILFGPPGRLLVRTRRDQPTTNPHQVGTFRRFPTRTTTGYDLHQLAELVDHYSDEAVKSATTTAAAT
jgi:hypothetical protein